MTFSWYCNLASINHYHTLRKAPTGRIDNLLTDYSIVGVLAKEHNLDDSETDKRLLDVEDFLEVLY